MSILFAWIISIRVKWNLWEPGFPVAAVERGRQVIVGKNQSFEVADHDFCKLSITPSVTFVFDLPDDIQGSFYRGRSMSE